MSLLQPCLTVRQKDVLMMVDQNAPNPIDVVSQCKQLSSREWASLTALYMYM